MADEVRARAREARLKAALRDNLRKRKARDRDGDAPPEDAGASSAPSAGSSFAPSAGASSAPSAGGGGD